MDCFISGKGGCNRNDGNKITFSGRDFRGSDTTAVYEFSENGELVITFSNGKKGTYKKTAL